MVDSRFDVLVKLMSEGGNRRAAVAALVGGMFGVGAGLRAFGLVEADTRQKKGRKACRRGRQRCRGHCIPRTACCTQTDCPAGTFCQHGGCFRGCTGATGANCLISGACGGGACLQSVAGANACADGVVCEEAQPCESDAGCPLGEVCFASGCCSAFGKLKTCAKPRSG